MGVFLIERDSKFPKQLRHSHFRNEFKSSHCDCIGALAGDSCDAGSGEGANLSVSGVRLVEAVCVFFFFK